MIDFTVRPTSISDIHQLTQWRMRVLREVFADATDVGWEALEAANRRFYIEHISAETLEAVWAINCEGTVMGCGDVCYQSELPSPDNVSGKNAYLMNIYVLPAFRRNGVGEAIVNTLVAKAKERKCGKIYLETTDCGQHLYRRCGFNDLPSMMIL